MGTFTKFSSLLQRSLHKYSNTVGEARINALGGGLTGHNLEDGGSPTRCGDDEAMEVDRCGGMQWWRGPHSGQW
jgi:hypothetical protein